MSLSHELAQLRTAGDSFELLRVLALKCRFMSGIEFVHQFTWQACPLLAAALACRQAKRTAVLVDFLQSEQWELCLVQLREHAQREVAIAVQERAKLICVLFNNDQESLAKTLDAVVKAIAGLGQQIVPSVEMTVDAPWHPQSASSVVLFRRTAAYRALSNTGWKQVFDTLAVHYGGFHPGLHLALDTVAFIFGRDRAAGPVVRTWVLGADDSGYAFKLAIERRENGIGMLAPHPLRGAYLSLDKHFQEGIQRAWYVVLGDLDPDQRIYDFRWWIEPAPLCPSTWTSTTFTGPSAAVAVACALKAQLAPQPEALDDNVAVTGELTWSGDVLPVGDIAEKLTSEMFRQELGKLRIRQLLIGAPETEQTLDNGQLSVKGVLQFAETYEQLARFPRMTRTIKQALMTRAQQILDAELHIPPHLSYKLTSEELGQIQRNRDDQEWRRLERADLERFQSSGELQSTHGQPRAGTDTTAATAHRRTRILCESGMGKSLYLVYLERLLAGSPELIIPVRLGAGPSKPATEQANRLPLLSDIPWDSPRESLLPELCREAFADLNGIALEEYPVEWFTRLVQDGNVVWLLDAIDQTDEGMSKLARFLHAQVPSCPVVLTGRPEVEQSKSKVFAQEAWQTLRLDRFDDAQIREYLGPDTDILCVSRGEKSRDRVSFNRKQSWHDLLCIPILLALMLQLARSKAGLESLKNRAAVYHAALTELIDKGLVTLRDSTSQALDIGRAEVHQQLSETAWRTIRETGLATLNVTGNFTGKISGDDFLSLKKTLDRESPNALEWQRQINVIALQAIFDNPRGTAYLGALTWRHLSFCEYFAGCHLVKLRLEEQRKIIGECARHDDWSWVFRFALMEAERANRTDSLQSLAHMLVEAGNPFLVATAILEDHVVIPPTRELDLEALVLWLVHRDHNYTEARSSRKAGAARRSRLDADGDATISILQTLFRPEIRTSGFLHAAWELLGRSSHHKAKDIQVGFLNEFPELCRRQRPVALSLRFDMDRDRPDPVVGNQTPSGQYRRCPVTGDQLTFSMGSPKGEADRSDNERSHQVTVSAFWLRKFVVTNEEYELFDLSHRNERREHNRGDGQPVTDVSWYEAVMFCRWLGAEYRLPTEAEWESACRAGTPSNLAFSFGDILNGNQANSDGNYPYGTADAGPYHGQATALGKHLPNAWGLSDMHGNVWEWCQDWYGEYGISNEPNPPGPSEGLYRASRGGGWFNEAKYCRAAFRGHYEPATRLNHLGFRLAVTPRRPGPVSDLCGEQDET